MTTASSPPAYLRVQADKIALTLKRASRGKMNHIEKVKAALQRDTINVAIIMDDKAIALDVPWISIRALSVEELSDFIIDLMREKPDAP